MLAVKPVVDIDIAREICAFCNIPFDLENFTYFAADVNEDASKMNYIIGVCTCKIKGDVNRIEYLREANGVDDDEAMIIMARTVMNFMYRCEVKRLSVNPDGVSEKFIKKLGFRKDESGYFIELSDFYKSPCSYNG